MTEKIKDLQAVTTFGVLLCGALLGAILTGFAILKLEMVPSPNYSSAA
jgi:hypothetical protein